MHIFSHTEKLIWYFQEKRQVQLTNQKSNQLILFISASPLVGKKFKFPQYSYYWKQLWNPLFHAMNLNIKFWCRLYLMIIKKLFRRKARFLIFHKILLLYMELRTVYTAFTLLWRMNLKFEKPVVLLLQVLKMIQELCKKVNFLKVILQSPQRWNTKFLPILIF